MKKTFSRVLQAHYMFMLLGLVFGILFTQLIPPLWGIDEITHFSRAYQISTGDFMEDKLSTGGYGGKLPQNLVELNGYVYGDLTDNKPGTKQIDSGNEYGKIRHETASKTSDNYAFSGAGAYFPLAYGAPALGIAAARTFNGSLGLEIAAARTATLLVYIVLVFTALYYLRGRKERWIIFVVALIPMSLFQASIVSVDSLAIGTAILLFSVLRFFMGRNKPLTLKEVSLLLVLCAALPLTKPNYFIFTLACLIIPSSLLNSKKSRALAVRGLLLAVSLIPLLAWNYLIRHLIAAGTTLQLGAEAASKINPLEQLQYVLIHPLSFIDHLFWTGINQNWFSEMFGLLGWNYVFLPSILIGLIAVLLFMATMYRNERALERGKSISKEGLPYLSIGLLVVLSVAVVFYLTFNQVGAKIIGGVQGRYFLPALPFIAYGLRKIVPVSIEMNDSATSWTFYGMTFIGLLTSCIIYLNATYL